MKNFEIQDITPTILPFPSIQEKPEVDDEFDAIDPYQEFFDFLVAEGAPPGQAWDTVWENPRPSAQIGMKLAAHRIEPSFSYAMAS